MAIDELDLDNRRLCPDGACIGVIGPDGRCRACGRAAEPGAEPAAARAPAAAVDDEPEEPEEEAVEAATDADEGAAGFEADRQLCPDGACIGVIGDDGRCKVCGTPAGS